MKNGKTKITSLISVAMFSVSVNAAEPDTVKLDTKSVNGPALLSAGIDSSQCNIILENAAADITLSTSTEQNEAYVYSQACGSKYTQSSGSKRAGLDVLWGSIGVSISGDITNDDTNAEAWCDTNESKYSDYIDTFDYQKEVSDAALSTFNSCVSMATQNFKVDLIDLDNLTRFDITNYSISDVELRDIIVVTEDSSTNVNTDPNILNVQCIVSSGSNGSIPAKDAIVPMPRNQSVAITCERPLVPIIRDNETIAVQPAYSIAFGGILGGYGARFVEKSTTKLTDLRANAIEARLGQIDERTNEAKAKLDKLPEDREWYSFSAAHNEEFINEYSYEIIVSAYGGNGGSGNVSNRCNLNIYVDGLLISYQGNANYKYSKGCNVSAAVPSGATWKIVSLPYGAGVGRFSTKVFH